MIFIASVTRHFYHISYLVRKKRRFLKNQATSEKLLRVSHSENSLIKFHYSPPTNDSLLIGGSVGKNGFPTSAKNHEINRKQDGEMERRKERKKETKGK